MEKAHIGAFIACVLAVFGLTSSPGLADDTAPAATQPPKQNGDQAPLLLPTISFRADAAGGDLYDSLQSMHAFAHLSKEAPGSPVQLRIYHSVHPAHVDAKNLFSGLLAVGTLGLSPVIMSGEHTMHYELFVNGQRIARYEYSTKLSRKEHLNGNAADATHGLGPDGVPWAKSTVELFLKDLAHDNAVRALNEEYQLYFGVPAVGPAASPAH